MCGLIGNESTVWTPGRPRYGVAGSGAKFFRNLINQMFLYSIARLFDPLATYGESGTDGAVSAGSPVAVDGFS